MNIAILKGRLIRDVDKKTTPNRISVATFSMAVRRNRKNASGEYDADFINCVAWRNTADFVAKYFQKGSEILVKGEIQSRSYEDSNGSKRYITEVNVNEVDFCGSTKKAEASQETSQETGYEFLEEEFEPVKDDKLPF